MTMDTHNPAYGSTNRSFSTTDTPVLPGSYMLVGNLIPEEWYQKFTNNRGVPDLSLMSILSEIVYWYRPKKIKNPDTKVIAYVNKFLGDAWQTSYEHFEKKFGFNREKIRRVFVKLEQMGICAREFRAVKLRGQTYNNRLFIHLSSDFLNSCTNKKKKVSDYTACNVSFYAPKEEGGSPHLEGNHIIDTKNKNINEVRSMKSNFIKNSFSKKRQGDIPEKSSVISPPAEGKTPVKQLEDFYPLSETDGEHLQIKCGRAFSLNAMNEILLDMSKRLNDRRFKSKKCFLSYMSIAFRNEMRDACKVSNDNFKIRTNQTTEEAIAHKQEELLSKIEYSQQISPEWHFKKKLCAVLERGKAYSLLSSYKHCGLKDDIFEIYLTKHVKLTSQDLDIILNQARASHDSTNLATGNLVSISSLKIVSPSQSVKTVSITEAGQGKELPVGIWGSIREALIGYFGTEGEALDKSWFSKLEPEIDEEAKKIILKAPSDFFKDWISQNYSQVLERYFAHEQYSYEIC